MVQHGESGSFLLRNVYEGDTGKLTVKKLFSGRDADDAYPDVTFDVYRYYVDEEGNVSDAGLAASHTVTGDEFKLLIRQSLVTLPMSTPSRTCPFTRPMVVVGSTMYRAFY